MASVGARAFGRRRPVVFSGIFVSPLTRCRPRVRLVLLALVATWCSSVSVPAQGPAPPLLDRLTIVAPGAPSGGWARTAENMARALRAAGLVGEVTVVSRPGDGGTLALAEFASTPHSNDNVLLVGGSVMIGAAPPGSPAASDLMSVVPIARLTGESMVLAVAATSPFRTLDDLVAAMRQRPASIVWVGGPYSGANHTALTMIADAAGLAAGPAAQRRRGVIGEQSSLRRRRTMVSIACRRREALRCA